MNRLTNISSTTQEMFLWEETESERGVFSWQKAVAFPMLQEQADALRVVMSAMFPQRTFETSQYKPRTMVIGRR